jgi:hypothetical protein
MNRLQYAKLNNPLLSQSTDEELLNFYHRQNYSDMDFDSYKIKMLETIPASEYNKFVFQSIKPREELEKTDGFDDGYAELYKNYSQEQIDQWKSKGTVGIFEDYNILNSLDCLPMAGDFKETYQNNKLLNLKEKVQNKAATPEEEAYFNESMDKIAELSVRGNSIGKNIVSGVCGSVRMMGNMVLGIQTYGASYIPNIMSNYSSRKLNDNIMVTDRGQVFFTEYNKAPITTILKAVGDVGVTFVVEMYGGELINKLGGDYINNFVKKATGLALPVALQKFGFNGLIGELGEERLEDAARFVFKLDDKKYSWNNFIDSVIPNGEEFLTEIGVISVLGAGGTTVSKISEKLYNKLKSRDIDENDIASIIANTSENDKLKMLRQIENIETKQETEAYNEAIDNFKKEIVEAGLSEQYAEDSVKLFEAQYSRYLVGEGRKRIDVFNELKPNLKKVDRTKINEGSEDSVEKFYQDNPEVESKIDKLIKVAKNNKNINETITLGKVNDSLASTLKENGLDVSGYEHEIDAESLRHINNRHGENNEKQKDQLPISDNDIKNIPYIIENYDYIEINKRNNKNGLRYIKTMNDGTTYYVEEVRDKNKKLVAKTMYKKIGVVDMYKPTNATSEATPIKIIGNPNAKVKQNQITANSQLSTINSKNQPLAQIDFSNPNEAIISLFENFNPSSPIHEFGHYFRRLTESMAKKGSKLAQKDLESMNSWLTKAVKKTKTMNDGDYETAKSEYFARSVEAYLRRGIAPTREMRGVFERFREWLGNVYKTIRELNVKLTHEVIEFFDGYFTADTESDSDYDFETEKLQREIEYDKEEIYNQDPNITAEEVEKILEEKYGERLKELENVITEKDYEEAYSIKRNTKETNLDNKKTRFLKPIMVNSNVIRELGGNKMEARLRRLELEKRQTASKYLDRFKPFVEKYKQMDEKDRVALDLAMFNGDTKKINELLDKYHMQAEYQEKQRIQQELKEFAQENGIAIGEIDYEYNPRRVKNYDRFIDYLDTKNENVNLIRKEVEKLNQKTELTPEEKERKISEILNGYINKLSTGSVANAKKRNINILKPEYLKFYYNSADATSLYIRDIIERSYNNELFGKGDNLDEQISTMVNLEEKLTANDKKDLLQAIKNVAKPDTTNGVITRLNSIASVLALNKITTALRQGAEISTSIIYNGLFSTLKSLGNDIKISQSELKLASSQAAELMTENTNFQKINDVVTNIALKPFGLMNRAIDIVSQKSFFENMKNISKEELAMDLMLFFNSEQRVENVLNDIETNRETDDLNLYIGYKISQVRPFLQGDKPFLASGTTGNLFYSLKSYFVKQMSLFVFDIIPQLNTLKGWGMLARYIAINSIVNGLINIGIDRVVGILTGDDEEEDYLPYFIYGAMPFGVITDYSLQKFMRGDIIEGLGLVPAAASVFEQYARAIIGDVKEGEVKRTLKVVPFGGDILYKKKKN